MSHGTLAQERDIGGNRGNQNKSWTLLRMYQYRSVNCNKVPARQKSPVGNQRGVGVAFGLAPQCFHKSKTVLNTKKKKSMPPKQWVKGPVTTTGGTRRTPRGRGFAWGGSRHPEPDSQTPPAAVLPAVRARGEASGRPQYQNPHSLSLACGGEHMVRFFLSRRLTFLCLARC